MTTALSDAGLLFANGDTQTYPSVPVRQTVLSGPVDTNGMSAFGGAIGATTVTSAGTLIVTAANGVSNRTGSKVNPSWTGLSTNGTMYLYADVNTDGTITEGSNALLPIYQSGGTPAVTAGQFTYNIQQMQGFLGNGAAAPAGYRVYVGEVTVAAGLVSAIVWYSLMGQFITPFTATLPGAGVTATGTHNLGFLFGVQAMFEVECTTANIGYSIGDQFEVNGVNNGTFGYPAPSRRSRTSVSIIGGSTPTGFLWADGGTGAGGNATLASWKWRFKVKRTW